MKKITIYGAGYVGLVTGVCFAELGNQVLCVDIDAERVKRLKSGDTVIYEPGLDALLAKNLAAGRIDFTTDMARAVAHGAYQFIAVGTPPRPDGSADLKFVEQVAHTIGQHMAAPKVIVNKSTVPVGTEDQVTAIVQAELDQREQDTAFDVVSNPEFLREGVAINDFMQPDRIVVGANTSSATDAMRALYAPLIDQGHPFLAMDVRSAELTKYAANAMLATKISFMNEMSRIADAFDADIEQVRIGIGMDSRIGSAYIQPGAGYGGSCFPKDVRALISMAESRDVAPDLLNAVTHVNRTQKMVLFNKLNHFFGDALAGKTIALWGLAFKPDTDDMREASSCVLMEQLWDAGVFVQAHDPAAMDIVAAAYPDHPQLKLCATPEDALKGADVLVVITEWDIFKAPDFDMIKESLTHPVIFDGRNLYDPEALDKKNIAYYGIGRRNTVRATRAGSAT